MAVGQVPAERVDLEMIQKFKEEGLNRSQIMDTISYLTDVHGPRLTGSPQSRVAGDWTVGRLTEWGLEGATLEGWGPFGRGWEMRSCSVQLAGPSHTPLIAYPKAWSPSTQQKIRGTPIYLNANTSEELNAFRGKLGRAIVLISPPREVKAWFEPPGTRQTAEDLLSLSNADPFSPRVRRPPAGAPTQSFGGRPGPSGNGPAGGIPSGPGTDAAGTTTGNAASANQGGSERAAAQPDPRNALQISMDKFQLAYEEGAAVVIEAGRGDGGTVFLASATMPRAANSDRENNNPFSRGPRPWAPDAPDTLPQLVMAAEHYGRLVRMIERGAAPELEIDIENEFFSDNLDSFNIVAEIPGSDLKDEVVMLGAHFDSWHSGTGATDNAVGCGVAMEAVRILQATGVKPRRTIRIALWTGEEQGLLGSRAYVAKHFGSVAGPQRGFSAGAGDGQTGGRRRNVYELTPAHEKVSAYFNLDNGTGKIRGIYLQGNESARPIFRSWLTPFADMGANTITASNTGGTDHLSFDGIGIPGFQFIQDAIEYDTRTHHSSMDVFERIQEDDVKQASVIMASFVYHAAMRDERIPRKPLDGEIVWAPSAIQTSSAVPVFAPMLNAGPPSPVAIAP